jgi:hypothetical protein
MALQSHGVICTETDVNKVMGCQPQHGASWEQALATAQYFGARVTLVCPSTVEQLRTWTDLGIPVLIGWNPENRPWSHASVVFDVDANSNIYVADPNIPDPKETIRIIPEKTFYKKWYEKTPTYLVRRVAMAIDLEIDPSGNPLPLRTL